MCTLKYNFQKKYAVRPLRIAVFVHEIRIPGTWMGLRDVSECILYSTKVRFYQIPFYQSLFYQSPDLLVCILPKSGLPKKCDSIKFLSTKVRPPLFLHLFVHSVVDDGNLDVCEFRSALEKI
jgi:hypothetical protein